MALLKEEIELCDAARNGHLRDVSDLLERAGVNVHVDDDFALRWSARNGHYDVVKLLLCRRANVHAMEDEALRFAAQNGHAEIVSLLLEHNANVFSLNQAALIVAASRGHFDVVQLLLDKGGGDVHVQDDSALFWAAYGGYCDVVQMLLDKGANIFAEKLFPMTASHGQLSVMKLLLENEPSIIMNNNNNDTGGLALCEAVAHGYMEIVDFLLQQGVDVHVFRDKALRLAIERRHFEIVRALLECGAELTFINDSFAECFFLQSSDQEQVLKILSEFVSKERIFFFACASNYSTIVTILMNQFIACGCC